MMEPLMKRLGLALLVTLLGVAGCTRDRTQIMIGLATDLRARNQIDEVVFRAWRLDKQGKKIEPETFIQSWTLASVPSEIYELPGSIGLYSPDGTEPRVYVTVEGKLGGATLVTREAIFSLVAQQTLFLRLTLVSRCMNNTQCTGGDVCVEGDCKPRELESLRLPKYNPPPLGEPDHQVTAVDCVGAISYIRTTTGEPMPVANADGLCPKGTFCQEGTCLKELSTDALDGGVGDLAARDLGGARSVNLVAVTGRIEQNGTVTLFTAADDGTIYRQDDATNPNLEVLRTVETIAPQVVRGLLTTPTGEILAVGDGGLFLRRTATGWVMLTSPEPLAQLLGINGDATGVLICGGANASSRVYTATYPDLVSTTATLPASMPTLRSVSSPAVGHVYAVGNGRAILRGDGAAWSQIPVAAPPPDGLMYDFYDVAGPSADHFYAVGSLGQVARIDELSGVFSSVTFESLGTVKKLNTVVFVDASQEWLIAGEDGELWSKLEPGAWQKLSTPFVETFNDSWTQSGHVFIVGQNGAQLYRAPVSIDMGASVPLDLGGQDLLMTLATDL